MTVSRRLHRGKPHTSEVSRSLSGNSSHGMRFELSVIPFLSIRRPASALHNQFHTQLRYRRTLSTLSFSQIPFQRSTSTASDFAIGFEFHTQRHMTHYTNTLPPSCAQFYNHINTDTCQEPLPDNKSDHRPRTLLLLLHRHVTLTRSDSIFHYADIVAHTVLSH